MIRFRDLSGWLKFIVVIGYIDFFLALLIFGFGFLLGVLGL